MTFRNFVHSAASLVFLLVACTLATAAERSPNIVVIFIDDK